MLRAALAFCLFGLNPDLSWPKSQYRLSLGIKVGYAKVHLFARSSFYGNKVLSPNLSNLAQAVPS